MQSQAADKKVLLSPGGSRIMMDGSVISNREEAVAAIGDQGGLRHRAVNKPEEVPEVPFNEEAMKDLEASKSPSDKRKGTSFVASGTSVRFSSRGEDDIETFPENTFSFFLLARYPFCERPRPEFDEHTGLPVPPRKSRDHWCIPFWSALIVLILQIAIYTLALDNATDFSNKSNPFSFPIDVDVPTRAAELVAVMITVYTENNLFQGVDQFVQSYKALIETSGVTRTKYYISSTTQVLCGLYGIFVTFIIIMQAEGVVDLLLDFTAMEFVAALDDAAFHLALKGFFGGSMKKTARAVKSAEYSPRDKRKWLRKWPLFVLFAGVMTCYVIVRVNQNNRAFGTNEIYVQFHDDVLPWLSTLSGLYIGCNLKVSDFRRITRGKSYSIGGTIYSTVPVADCQDNWEESHGAFFFCDKKRWVFAVGENMMDPCDKWAMHSVRPKPELNDEYDIIAHSAETWLARDPTRNSGTGVVEEIQFLAGFEPSQNAGQDCSVLASTGNVFSYPFYGRIEEAVQEKSFFTERPVYFAGDNVEGEYIFHTGRRWVVVKASGLPDCVRNCKPAEPETCCKLDPFTSNYTVSFISDPMDLRRVEDTWIPASDLTWYEASSPFGNSSAPIIQKQSLVDQIDVIEALSSIGAFPSEDERKQMVALHLESARLSCLCDAGNAECERTVSCGADEITVWIDLQTDDRPQDTYFVVASNETWVAIENEAKLGYEFTSVRQSILDGFTNGMTSLNDTGYFGWQDVWNTTFAAKSNYQYTTCMPKNQCGFVYIEDLAGNGITFPGRFNVYLNTKRLERNNGGRHCVYDLCDESATCFDTSFGSELFNPTAACGNGQQPLSFQFFKDTSISVVSRTQWLLGDEGDGFGNGIVSWGNLQFNAERQIWNDIQFWRDTEFYFISDVPNENFLVSPVRTLTCVPDTSCVIVDFDILDVPYEEVVSGDTGKPFERPLVVYNGTQISPAPDEGSTLDHCIYQFGANCPTEIICSDSEIQRPYSSPTTDCGGEKSLAFEVKTDIYAAETSIVVSDLETWTSGILSNFTSMSAAGRFEWGNLRWGSLEIDDEPASFQFVTCVPDDTCGVVVLGDSYSDGIVDGGMTLVYNDEEILFGPTGEKFSTCVFQFGDLKDCETKFTCYDSKNPPPPYNPQLECDSGTTPVAFELRTDCCTSWENSIFVTDLDSWDPDLAQSFPYSSEEGFFEWGSFQLGDFRDNGVIYRYSTCVPADVCGVVAINDSYGDGLVGGSLTLVYDNTETISAPANLDFRSCVYQFGSCDTQVLCNNEINTEQPSSAPSRPPFDPDVECLSGSPLAFELLADSYSNSENRIVVTDLGSWNQGLSPLFPNPVVDATGYFEWGDVRITSFENNAPNRFGTCVPDGTCSVLALEDTANDGIWEGGGIKVFFDNNEILFESLVSRGEYFTDCVFQFGACESGVVCYNLQNPLPTSAPLPAFNPELDCTNGKSLAFDFNFDSPFLSHSITVTDFYSWSRGIASDAASTLSGPGFFEWGSAEFSSFESGVPHRFSTCVPDDVCGILALEDKSGAGFEFGGLFTVYYDQQEMIATNLNGSFHTCQYQFGACGQEASCSEDFPPVYNPEIECIDGTPLSFDFHSDSYPSESDIIVTDFDTWVQELWAGSASALFETGSFDWGTVQITGFNSSSSHHFNTCVPNDVCGVVVIRDSVSDGVFTKEGLRVVYDQQEIPAPENQAGTKFTFCEYQFGSCGQGAYCVAPPTMAPTTTAAPTPVVTIDENCADTVGWVDVDGDNCDWYMANQACESASSYTNLDGLSAIDACCYCGGGTRIAEDCADNLGWVDSGGDDCLWYMNNQACESASSYINLDGISAIEACCYCGGGISTSSGGVDDDPLVDDEKGLDDGPLFDDFVR